MAGRIEDGDVVDIEARHGRRDQMPDRGRAPRPTVALARIMTEAVGVCSALRKLPRSGMTMWTRAAAIAGDLLDRAGDFALERPNGGVTSCMKDVSPSEPTLSKSS